MGVRMRHWLRRVGAKRIGVAFVVCLVLAVGPAAAGSPVDDTPPIVTYSVFGIVGTNGWYRGSTSGNFVSVQWSVSDPESPIISSSGCEPGLKVDGPNTGTTRTCSATSQGGTTTVTTKVVKIDADPPAGVSAVPDRRPDANGWYNHPLFVRWQGSDATSGIAGCTAIGYRGPNVAPGSLSGGCTDQAGNSAGASFGFNYDGRHPRVKALAVQSYDGRNVVHWRSSGKADVAVIKRIERGSKKERVVFHRAGTRFADTRIRDGVEYRYTVQTYDQAANASKPRSVLAPPKVVTFGIPYTPRTAAVPILRWGHVRGVGYYHVQLFRGGKRILAAWPLKPQLALHAKWTWGGRRYRLAPGRYAWYAWAGFGARAAAHYRPIGHALFIIPRR